MSFATLKVRTDSRTEYVDVTERVQQAVGESGISDGICLVSVPHTTAGVTINEAADPSVRRDIIHELDKVIPYDDNYKHMEGNSAAHIKTTLTGSSVLLIVEDGKLVLGTWQGIYFCEYDGPRRRTLHVKVLG